MARHRLGACGNAITLPLPWEDLLQHLQGTVDHIDDGGVPSLPRSGEQLADIVRILLKTNKTGATTDAEIKGLVHQANVRRAVVVNLILDMKAVGHPAYQTVSEASLWCKAAGLPEDGVPPQIVKIINELDDSQDKLQPQKAATPCDGMQDIETAGMAFASQRARAVVAKGQSVDTQDANRVAVTALQDMAEQAHPNNKVVDALEVRMGNEMMDQFQPFYFAVAFCFCFKYSTACPD
eukprot:4715225-Amphidinium_carterae.1